MSRAQSPGQVEIDSPQVVLSQTPLPHLFWQLVALVVLSTVTTGKMGVGVGVGVGVEVEVGVGVGVELGEEE